METTRKLLRMQAIGKVGRMIDKLHPADVAHILPYFGEGEQRTLLSLIPDPGTAAEVLSELDWGMSARILEAMESGRVIQILKKMPSDDAAEILSNLPEDVAEEFLQGIKKDDVEDLLSYPEETAGRIMNPDVFSLHEDATVREAMKAVRGAADAEMVFYIYVVDDRNHLVEIP
jgi:magnesium transporter